MKSPWSLRSKPPAPAAAAQEPDSDPLLAFAAESGEPAHAAASPLAVAEDRHLVSVRQFGSPSSTADLPAVHPREAAKGGASPMPQRRWTARLHAIPARVRLWAAAAVGIVAIAAAFLFTYSRTTRVEAADPPMARYTLETTPPGAHVMVDGQSRGDTPLSLRLAAGAHSIVLRRGTEERSLPLMLAAGADRVEHVEFGGREAATQGGGLSIVTEPPGARVDVNGQPRGITPLTLNGLAPSDYKVSVSNGAGAADRVVTVAAGTTSSVIFTLPKTAATPAAGWLAVSSPFSVQVRDGESVVGEGKSVRILLPAGRHALTLSNDEVGYHENRSVDLATGATANIQVSAPQALVNVNARPWADVLINGRSIGQTPIANLSLPIGTYEVVFRHPQLGERKATVSVTVRGPNRISMDLTSSK